MSDDRDRAARRPAAPAGRLRGLATFDWVAFTSAHAVDAVSSHPEWQQAVEAGALPRVAAVGDASAARLAADRVMVDVVPDGVGAPALADAIARVAGVMSGVRVLWPRGDLAQMTFARGLGVRRRQRDGADRLSDPGAGRRIAGGVVRRARLESGGSYRVLLAVERREPGPQLGTRRPLDACGAACRVASIGPTTSAALRTLGVEADVQADEPTMVSLAEAIAARLGVTAGEGA